MGQILSTNLFPDQVDGMEKASYFSNFKDAKKDAQTLVRAGSAWDLAVIKDSKGKVVAAFKKAKSA